MNCKTDKLGKRLKTKILNEASDEDFIKKHGKTKIRPPSDAKAFIASMFEKAKSLKLDAKCVFAQFFAPDGKRAAVMEGHFDEKTRKFKIVLKRTDMPTSLAWLASVATNDIPNGDWTGVGFDFWLDGEKLEIPDEAECLEAAAEDEKILVFEIRTEEADDAEKLETSFEIRTDVETVGGLLDAFDDVEKRSGRKIDELPEYFEKEGVEDSFAPGGAFAAGNVVKVILVKLDGMSVEENRTVGQFKKMLANKNRNARIVYMLGKEPLEIESAEYEEGVGFVATMREWGSVDESADNIADEFAEKPPFVLDVEDATVDDVVEALLKILDVSNQKLNKIDVTFVSDDMFAIPISAKKTGTLVNVSMAKIGQNEIYCGGVMVKHSAADFLKMILRFANDDLKIVCSYFKNGKRTTFEIERFQYDEDVGIVVDLREMKRSAMNEIEEWAGYVDETLENAEGIKEIDQALDEEGIDGRLFEAVLEKQFSKGGGWTGRRTENGTMKFSKTGSTTNEKAEALSDALNEVAGTYGFAFRKISESLVSENGITAETGCEPTSEIEFALEVENAKLFRMQFGEKR